MSCVGKHKTTVYDDCNFTYVKYHNTDVVKFNRDTIVLNTGGYTTPTTKRRMNQTSAEYNLGYYVFQKNYEFFVNYKDQTLPLISPLELRR